MSFEPYQCLHVPVKAAQVRVCGLPLGVVWLAAAVAAVKVCGPWLFLAPVVVILVTVAVVIVLAVVRADPATADGDGHAGAPVEVLTGAPVVVLSGTGPLPCMGCGTGPATGVLEVAGYRVPVCGSCQATAAARLAGMNATGVLRALE